MNQNIRIMILLFLSIFFVQNLKASFCCKRSISIDSLQQLKYYDFIALVKIIDDVDLQNKTTEIYEPKGLLTVKIIELFKGEKVDKILEFDKHTTCDIGISLGEEWIVFGKKTNGKMSIFSSARNIRYKKNNGLRDWRNGIGFNELNQLRKLYQHPTKEYNNETRKEFYSNGQVEIIANYSNDKLNGDRTIWYPNGTLLGKHTYVNDSLNGNSKWFFPSGQIHEEEYNLKGKNINVSRYYYDSTTTQSSKLELLKKFYKEKDSLDLVPNRVQLRMEYVYDSNGEVIISREYSILGKLDNERFTDPVRKFSTVIFYHNNGTISSIGYTLSGKNYGHFQKYDEKGFPIEGCDYDEKGNKKN